MEDGSILGDPVNVEFTDLCISLGWTPKYGRWDVLPLVVMNDGGEPVWRDIPAKYAKEIKVTHPTLDWFEELDLRWFDHPPVSCRLKLSAEQDWCLMIYYSFRIEHRWY
jgi:nitric oxide synthase oxygenase domain/subunit